MMHVRWLAFLFTFVVTVIARAQSSDAGIASQLFDAGRDAMKRGDYASACPKLSESARLEPRVGTLARLAECEEKIGHLSSARGHWKDTVDLARAQKDDRAGHAESEYKRVDALVPRVLLKTASTPPGFAVQLDDVAVGAESMNLALPIDPGHHTVVATATDKSPWRGSIDANPDGATTTLEIPVLEAAPAHVVESHGNAQPAAATMITKRPLRGVGIGITVAGAVVLAAGASFSGAAIGYHQAAGCTDSGVCPDRNAANQYDTARGFADATTIAFIAGGVLAVTGVLLIVLAPKVVTRVGANGWAVAF